MIKGEHGFYAKEVWFSDWRGAPEMDYSTNALVSNYYSGGHAKYFRLENMEEFAKVWGKGVRVGVDYYALFNVSRPFVEQYFPGLLLNTASDLERGSVVIVEGR